MPVHIIVDGYNLIGAVAGLRGNLEARRERLIGELAEYRNTRGYPITIVFDGWRSGWINEVEERRDGIRVLYSKRGEKADSVIIRLAREMGSGCVVVTSDREVRIAVESCGAVPVYAGQFHAKLSNPSTAEFTQDEDQPGEPKDRSKKGNPRRLSKRERRMRERLRKLWVDFS